MTVLSIILGVLLVMGGFSLLFTPLATFMGMGYFVIILFFVHGIFGIIKAISSGRYGMEFFFSIASLLLGILGFVVPGAAVMNNFMILYFAAAWFILRGIMSIVLSASIPKVEGTTGAKVFGVILGVLEVILGIYSFVHPLVLAITIGYLIGFYFIESGVNMIVLGAAVSASRD